MFSSCIGCVLSTFQWKLVGLNSLEKDTKVPDPASTIKNKQVYEHSITGENISMKTLKQGKNTDEIKNTFMLLSFMA